MLTLVFSASITIVSTKPLYSQWWNPFAPNDYEDCAESAAKDAKSDTALHILLNSCETKFRGRRKLGGGYTYYDSRQERYFDIAGPNPTSRELEYINNQYSVYLEEQRKAAAAQAAQAELERQRQEAQADLERRRLQEAQAEFFRRQQIALRNVQVISQDIKCTIGGGLCGLYKLFVGIKNNSSESLSAVSLGWAFLSMNETNCPSALPTRTREFVNLRAGDTTVLNLDGYDGPNGQFRFCVRVTGVDIVP